MRSTQRTNTERKGKNVALLLSCIVFACLPATLFAATLSLDPAEGSYGPGDTFVLTIRLDLAPDECINAARIELRYPTGEIKASAVSKGESLFTLFTEEPSVDHERGIIAFEGGIPGGYCGRIQGDPGRTNTLGRVILNIPGNMIGGSEVNAPGAFDVVFAPSTSVLLNDGLGSPAELALSGGHYVRLTESSGQRNEWLDIVHADTLPPEPFTVSILNDPQIFDGNHFIVFSTVDKQSGIDHFEVMEDDPVRSGFIENSSKKSIFITATSPYLLTDQKLKSRITVRALDHAGNIQETITMPAGSEAGGKSTDTFLLTDWRILAAPLLAVALLLAYWYIRQRRMRNELMPPGEIGSP